VQQPLLAAFSHDLRAPLARLIQASRVQPQSAGDEAAYRAAVAACARQQLALLDDLLDYTRYGQTPPEVVAAPTGLYALFDGTVREARAASAAGTQVTAVCDDRLPPMVVLDATLLRQVLRKLLAALGHGGDWPAPVVLALDATGPVSPQGRIVLRFSVGARAASGTAETVDIDAAALAAGSGAALDLALACQLLRAAGSRLQREAASHTGIGAAPPPRFFFELDVAVAVEADAMLPLPVLSSETLPSGAPRRILVVDTAPVMLDYLGDVLEHGGFDVDRAGSAGEALDLHGAQSFPLVLCGHQQPGLDAWDLLRRLGPSPMAPSIVLHALTPPQRPRGFPPQLDFAAVLYRPAAPDLLLTVLGELEPNGVRR